MQNAPEVHILHFRYVLYRVTQNIMIYICRGMSPLTPYMVGILIAIFEFMLYNNKYETMPIFHKIWDLMMELQKT